MKKILLLVLCHVVFNSANVEGAATHNFCANPVPSDNPVDVKWLHQHFEDGWNMQFSDPETRQRIAKFTKGVKADVTEEDYPQMCSRLKLDYTDNHYSGAYSAFGKSAVFNCSPSLACDVTSSDNVPVGSLQSHISYFDGASNHNMVALIQCLPNGKAGYAVLTNSKTISDEETRTITDHLRSIGFNPDDRVPLTSSSC